VRDGADEYVVDRRRRRLHRHVDGRPDAVDRRVVGEFDAKPAVPVVLHAHVAVTGRDERLAAADTRAVGRLPDVVRAPGVDALGESAGEPLGHVLDDENPKVRVQG